jgi:hypothetical protein
MRPIRRAFGPVAQIIVVHGMVLGYDFMGRSRQRPEALARVANTRHAVVNFPLGFMRSFR